MTEPTGWTTETKHGPLLSYIIFATAPDGQRYRIVSDDRKIFPMSETKTIQAAVAAGNINDLLAGDYELEPVAPQ